jgi:hypothetical protein
LLTNKKNLADLHNTLTTPLVVLTRHLTGRVNPSSKAKGRKAQAPI